MQTQLPLAVGAVALALGTLLIPSVPLRLALLTAIVIGLLAAVLMRD